MESSLLLSSLTSPTASVLLLGLTDSRAYTTPSADGQKCELYVKQETGRLCLTNVQLAKVPSCAQWTPASPHPIYPVPTRPVFLFQGSRLLSMGSRRVGHDWATSLSRVGEGNGNPLQCSCLENPRDGGAWWAAVYGVAQSWTRLKRLSSSSSLAENSSFTQHWLLAPKQTSHGQKLASDTGLMWAGFTPLPRPLQAFSLVMQRWGGRAPTRKVENDVYFFWQWQQG